MNLILTALYSDVVNVIGKPRRLVSLFDREKLRRHIRYLKYQLIRSWLGNEWTTYNPVQNFQKRVYRCYEEYLSHQKHKLQRLELDAYDTRYLAVLRERLGKLNIVFQSKGVLCLAARIGTEVKAFNDMGCLAVGIDLNPGIQNRWVLYGDFHDLQFSAGSIDVVFTNSLDHVFSIETVIAEIRRVLKPGGLLILEAMRGRDEAKVSGWSFYESFSWAKIDDLVTLLKRSQFKLLERCPFDYPWDGEQLCFLAEVNTSVHQEVDRVLTK